MGCAVSGPELWPTTRARGSGPSISTRWPEPHRRHASRGHFSPVLQLDLRQHANVASACALPRVIRFIRQAFDRSVVGFVVSLGLLRICLIRLLLVFVPTAEAAHALRVSADRHQAEGGCKDHNCRFAPFHVLTCNLRPTTARLSSIRTVD